MTSRVTASTVARFATRNSGFPLVIERDPGVFSDSDAHLLISPANVATKIVANVGSVRLGATKPVEVAGGILQVSGGSASLPRMPIYSSPEFRVLFAFDIETGDEITPQVTYNGVNNEVRLSLPCYAAIEYTRYTGRVQELIYTPLVEASSAGSNTTFGVIAAFAPPSSLTVYQVDGTTEAGTDDIELYRIISYAVTTPDGEFEMPPGYPGSGAYPGKPTLDLTTHLRTERVHEIGKMRSDGYAFVTTYNVTRLNPYIGDLGYTIPTVCRSATLDPNKYSKSVILKAKDFIASRGLGCGA